MLGQKHFVAGDKNLLFLSVYSNMAGEEREVRASLSDGNISVGSASAGPERKQIESDVAAAHVILQNSINVRLLRSFLLDRKLLFHLHLGCISGYFII